MIDPAIAKAEELIARCHKLQPSTRMMRERFLARIKQGRGPKQPFQSIGYWRNWVAALQLQVAVLSEPLIEKAKAGDQDAIRQINRGIQFLDRLEESRPAIEERKPRQGRIKTLSRLRAGWQELVFEQLSSKWQRAFAALALTGCRPAELNGLEIDQTGQAGVLKFRIWGKKLTEKAGQEWRELIIDVRGSGYGQALLLALGNEPGLIEIEETAQAVSKAITRAAQRAKVIRLDQTLPAYACRNALASGMKAQGYSRVEIAGALGHCSGNTQQFYGRARSGHKGPGGKILEVKTVRPVSVAKNGNKQKIKFRQ